MVQGSGFRVQGAGFRVQGSGFRVQGSGFRVYSSPSSANTIADCRLLMQFWSALRYAALFSPLSKLSSACDFAGSGFRV